MLRAERAGRRDRQAPRQAGRRRRRATPAACRPSSRSTRRAPARARCSTTIEERERGRAWPRAGAAPPSGCALRRSRCSRRARASAAVAASRADRAGPARRAGGRCAPACARFSRSITLALGVARGIGLGPPQRRRAERDQHDPPGSRRPGRPRDTSAPRPSRPRTRNHIALRHPPDRRTSACGRNGASGQRRTALPTMRAGHRTSIVHPTTNRADPMKKAFCSLAAGLSASLAPALPTWPWPRRRTA